MANWTNQANKKKVIFKKNCLKFLVGNKIVVIL